MRACATALAGCLVVVFATTTARADTAHEQAAAHFEKGRVLKEAGDCKGAVEELGRSIASEASVGAYYSLGSCYDDLRAWRKSVDAFHEAERLAHAKHDGREKDARDAADGVRSRHSFAIVVVPEAIAHARDVTISLDGSKVPPAEYNGEVFREGSIHTLMVSTPGHVDFQVTSNDRQTLEANIGPETPPTDGDREHPADAGTPVPWLKYAGLGLAGAGLVIGGGISLLNGLSYNVERQRDQDAVNADCMQRGATENVCKSSQNPDYAEFTHNESTALARIVVPGAIGVAAIGVGVIMYLLAPSASADADSRGALRRVSVVPSIGLGPDKSGGMFVFGSL